MSSTIPVDSSLDVLLGQDGPLAQNIAGYEDRPDQLTMAMAVDRCCKSGGSLIIEAGTGTGKSLAYLLPLVRFALREEVRVLVSTCTKTLQNQIMERELPLLQKTLGWDFRYCLCLGGENYLCRRRYRAMRIESRSSQRLWAEKTDMLKLVQWAERTSTGIRSEITFPMDNDLWDEIKRTADSCLGNSCPENRRCFYQRARREQYKSQVLVVNHHLFFTNLKTDGNLIASYDVAVFDEAHDLEDVAANLLGLDGSTWIVRRYVESLLGNPKRKPGLLDKWKSLPDEHRERISQTAQSVEEEGLMLFKALQGRIGLMEPGKRRILEPTGLFELWKPSWSALLDALQKAKDTTTDEDIRMEVEGRIGWGKEMCQAFATILEVKEPGCVYWAEVRRGRQGQNVLVAMRPLDVAKRFQESVLKTTAATIFVSATLSVGKKFDYIRSRLGLYEAEELLLDSPFDFSRNVLLYVDAEAPPPNSPEYLDYLVNRARSIIEVVEGGSFFLFTSHVTLREVYTRLENDYPTLGLENGDEESSEPLLMRQGEVSRETLLKRFREQGKGVLLGAFSFWQGVDVPGQALECVVMTRLPFEVPDEPIVQARMEQLEKEGKRPFWHYQIPNAIMRFRQGFGRLIRRKDDFGVVAVLDSRIVTQRYGKLFRDAIPKCSSTGNLDELRLFLKNVRRSRG